MRSRQSRDCWTCDAMGCQVKIAEKIKKDCESDYVLNVKGNQSGLMNDIAFQGLTQEAKMTAGGFRYGPSGSIHPIRSLLSWKDCWYQILRWFLGIWMLKWHFFKSSRVRIRKNMGSWICRDKLNTVNSWSKKMENESSPLLLKGKKIAQQSFFSF